MNTSSRADAARFQVALRLRILELNVDRLAFDVDELHAVDALDGIRAERLRLRRLSTNLRALMKSCERKPDPVLASASVPAPAQPLRPSAWQLKRWKAPVGEIFNFWQVLGMAEPKGNIERWLCRCLICEQEYIRVASTIRHRNTRCCLACYRKHGGAEIKELLAKQRSSS